MHRTLGDTVFFSPGFILIVLLVLVILWWIKPEFAKFLGYLFGGGLIIRQIAVTSRRSAAAEETAKAMQKTAELTERGSIAERFKNAIEHLGNDSVSVRLGGIYALHYIAQEVEDYRKRVFEILCAHIRETTTQMEYRPRNADSIEIKPTIEIQSILNLLFIEDQGQEIYKGLQGNLEGADLHGARFMSANLQLANLRGANLQNAHLALTNLQYASLEETKLQNATLVIANLQNAHLQGADLQNVSLWGADLQGADLRNVNLTNVKDLEVEKLLEAETLYMAKLPDRTKKEIMQKKPELFNNPDAKQED